MHCACISIFSSKLLAQPRTGNIRGCQWRKF